jgi:hypothetical protein
MAAETVLRFGDIMRTMSDLLRERKQALFAYLAAAVFLPWSFFFIFPQSNMRGFGAFFLNVGGWYSPETPWTIASMFMIAFVLMGAFVFAAWSALLAENRDEVSGEVMAGFVNSLLSSVVAFAIFLLLSIGFGLLLTTLIDPLTLLNPWMALATQLPMFLVYMFLLSRFCLAGPVMAAENSINPFTGLMRSWQLTAGHSGKVMLIIAPLYVLATGSVGVFLGIAILVLTSTDGTTWHDNGLSAGWLVIQTLLVLTAIIVPAAIYRAIRPAVNTEVFA